MKKKVAVVLSGSGYLDGSEIRESVATLFALSKHDFEYKCFCPDENQFHVVNHKNGEELKNQFRNQIIEASRIARGDIDDIKNLKAENFDAVIFPGGYGAAKNLSSYAFKGVETSIHPEIARVLNQFYQNKKPIGAICISPILVALNFKNKNFKLTLGLESKATEDAAKLGHTMYYLKSNETCVDKENLIVSTPAYMDDHAPIHEVFEGIEDLVLEIKNLMI